MCVVACEELRALFDEGGREVGLRRTIGGLGHVVEAFVAGKGGTFAEGLDSEEVTDSRKRLADSECHEIFLDGQDATGQSCVVPCSQTFP